MSELKYKVGDILTNISEDNLYESVGDLEILGITEEEEDFGTKRYNVKCFGDVSFPNFNEAELDYHFKIEEPKTEQIGGNHYSKLGIEPYEYSIKNDLNCYQFNVIKYVTRYKDKNGIEDLKKAINTLEKLIDYERSTN